MAPLTVCMLLAMVGCGTSGSTANEPVVTPPADVTLRIGESRTVAAVTIGFVKVNEDSRCPSDVQCVWAGNAAVELSLASAGASPISRVINSGIDPKTIEEHGLRISFRQLSPAPRQAAPDTSKPTVVLHVEKP